jgi:hypothetical protein
MLYQEPLAELWINYEGGGQVIEGDPQPFWTVLWRSPITGAIYSTNGNAQPAILVDAAMVAYGVVYVYGGRSNSRMCERWKE